MSVRKLIHKALSDSDIRTILGADTKILKYSELAAVGSLDELLPRLVDYCIILNEESLNRGHWVALLKYNDMFEHFDRCGVKPDNELQWINMKKRRMLKQATPYLSHLLDDERYIYNRVRYQELDSDVNTCGSHIVSRIYRLKHYNMDLDAYNEFMCELKDDYSITHDTIIAKFIDRWV